MPVEARAAGNEEPVKGSPAPESSLLVTYTDYLAGTKGGFYFPEYDRLTFNKKTRLRRNDEVEFCEELARQMAKEFYEEAKKDEGISPMEKYLNLSISYLRFRRIAKTMNDEMRRDDVVQSSSEIK